MSPDDQDVVNISVENQERQQDSQLNVHFDDQDEDNDEEEDDNEENIHILIDKEKLEQDVVQYGSDKKRSWEGNNRKNSKDRKQADKQAYHQKVKNYLYANSDSVNYTHPKKVKAKNTRTLGNKNIPGILRENKMLKKKSLQLYKTCQEFLYV